MKRIAAALACLCLIAPVAAIQEVTLKDVPPLQPLHWCEQADGNAMPQNEPCPAGTKEVSSWTQRGPDGRAHHLPLGEQPANMPGPEKAIKADIAASQQAGMDEKKAVMHDYWIRIGKWFGFALIVGLLGHFVLKRSFLFCFFIGGILRMILVAANVMTF